MNEFRPLIEQEARARYAGITRRTTQKHPAPWERHRTRRARRQGDQLDD